MELDLAGNAIGKEGAESIAEALRDRILGAHLARAASRPSTRATRDARRRTVLPALVCAATSTLSSRSIAAIASL